MHAMKENSVSAFGRNIWLASNGEEKAAGENIGVFE